MSLINQMLRDLESRPDDKVALGPLPAEVKAAPASSGNTRTRFSAGSDRRWFWLGGSGLLLVVVIVAVWWQQADSALKPQPVAASPALAPTMASTDASSAGSAVAAEASAAASLGGVSAGGEAAPAVATIIAPPDTTPQYRYPMATPSPMPKQGQKEGRIIQGDGRAVVPGPIAAPVAAIESSRKAEIPLRQLADNELRRANALVQQGRTVEALVVFERALQLDPSHLVARQAYVAQLLDANKSDEAASIIREGLLLEPSNPALTLMLARVRVGKGDSRGAIETLQQRVTTGRDLLPAEYPAYLAGLLQREGRSAEAIDQYLNALRIAPRNGSLWMELGIALQAENRLSEAADAFGRARATGTLSPDAQESLRKRIEALR